MARRKTPTSMDQRAVLPFAEENPDIEYLRLNRQEICEREINSAIKLFLVDEDPISAHVLASAATAIMEAVGKGRKDVGLNSVREILKEAEVHLIPKTRCSPGCSIPTISSSTHHPISRWGTTFRSTTS